MVINVSKTDTKKSVAVLLATDSFVFVYIRISCSGYDLQ